MKSIFDAREESVPFSQSVIIDHPRREKELIIEYRIVNGEKTGRETIAASDNEEGITIDRSVSVRRLALMRTVFKWKGYRKTIVKSHRLYRESP